MRKAREIKPGSYYHITARANRQEFILNGKEIKQLFIDVLKEAKQKYKFTLKNFCVMGNHVHLLLKPHKGEKLANIMKWLFGVFAQRFNNKHGYKGHVWYDRFHSVIVRSRKRMMRVFRYITDNPIRAKLVERPEDYEYGGYYWLKKKIYDLVDKPGFLANVVMLN